MGRSSESSSNTLRLFLAVFPSREQIRSIEALVQKLQGQETSFHPGKLRWVVPSKWHVTLRFLGDVPSEQLSSLKSELEGSVSGVKSFPFRLGGLSGFPRSRTARVLVVKVEEGLDEIRLLARRLEKSLSSLGFRREKRPFSPHLTLARVRRGMIQIPELDFLSPACLLSAIHLVQSCPSNGYKTLLKLNLE